MAKGIVPTPDDRLIVEVPLDADWLTPNGFYIAGYYWGKKIRSPDDPQVQRQDPNFIKGVEDGYGDGMAKNERSLKEEATRREEERRQQEVQNQEAFKMREEAQARFDRLMKKAKIDRAKEDEIRRRLTERERGRSFYEDDVNDTFGL